MDHPTLLADIGGTNMRLSLLAEAGPGPVATLLLDDHASIAAALAAHLATLPQRPRSAVLAVAGPVSGNAATLTNRGWAVEGAALAATLGLSAVRVVNDFEALAWSLPDLAGAALLPLGGGAGVAGAPMAVIGPGTGLGTAGFLPGVPPRVLAAEGGHCSLAAHDAREAAAIERLRLRYGHVSAERVLSGAGIVALHQALAEVDGQPPPGLTAAEITGAALAETDPACRATLAMWCTILGGVAGDLALVLGARGGVFLGGGILPRMPQFLAASRFRERFEAKGRLRPWLEQVPVWLILRPDPAMLGLAAMARAL